MLVYPLLSWQFLASFILFAVVLCSLFQLGYFWLRLTSLPTPLKIILGLSLGIVLYTFISFASGYAQLRFVSQLVLGAGLVAFAINFSQMISLAKESWKGLRALNRRIALLALLGIVSQVFVIFTSAYSASEGIYFHRLNAIDGVLHLGFSEFMKRDFPPLQPGAANLPITNYHYWGDLFLGQISRDTTIPVAHLYFHFMPLVISVLLAGSVYFLIREWGGTETVIIWGLFFHFLAGNATYIFMLLLHNAWGFYTPAIDHGMLQFLNPPQAFARLFFFLGIITFWKWLKQPTKVYGLMTVLFFSSLFGFKVYFGIFAAMGMTLLLAWKIIMQWWLLVSAKKKNAAVSIAAAITKQKNLLLLWALTAAVSLLIFLPTNKDAGGLVYVPLMWPKILLGQQNLDWNDWWLRQQVYEEYSNYRNLFIMNSIAVVIFMLSVYGTRIIGLIPHTLLSARKDTLITVFAWIPMLVFTFVGMNTIQSSGGANVFNFLVVSLALQGVFAAFWMEKLMRMKTLAKYAVVTLVLLLSLPRPLQDLYLFVKSVVQQEESFLISKSELEAFEFIRLNTPRSAVIFTLPNNAYNKETPYVPYFTQRYGYLAGIGILESHNQPIEERKKLAQTLVQISDEASFAQQAASMNVDYVFLSKLHRDQLQLLDSPASARVEKVFENEATIIYEINSEF